MYPECRVTVGGRCSDGEDHRRYSQSMRCEVVWLPWEGHTHAIGVGSVRLLSVKYESIEAADSAHTYAGYLVQQ